MAKPTVQRTDPHEMRMIDGRIVAVYTEEDGSTYRIIDGERHYLTGRPMRSAIHDADGVCVICGGDECGTIWCRGSGCTD